MHPIKSIALRTLMVLLAWPAAAQAVKVGTISALPSGTGTLLKISTDAEAKPKVSMVEGKKALIVVPGGVRSAMKALKVSVGILKGIRFGTEGGDLRIVADLKAAGVVSLGTVGTSGFEVQLAPSASTADAKTAAAPKAAPTPAADEATEAALNPASAGYTYRIVDLALAGDEEQGELVISSDGPASYKSSLKEDGKLLSLTFRNSSLAWSGDGARLSDSSVAGVNVRQLSEGGESVVKVDVRLREKLAYNLKRDQNQLVVRLGRPDAAAAAPRSGDLSTPISLDVEDADVVSLMKAICQQAGFEYQFTQGILAATPPSNQVTLRVRQRPFDEVAKTLLAQLAATFVREGNTLYIGSQGEIDARKLRLPTVERFYEPKYLTVVQLTNLLRIRFSRDAALMAIVKPDPNKATRFMLVGTAQEVSDVIAGIARYDVPEAGEQAASDEAGGGNTPRTQIFQLQYLDTTNSSLITTAIAQLYTDTDDPAPTPFIDGPSRTVVITTKMKYLRKIEKLLARIDVKPAQVNIEGKIVEMNQDVSRQLGIDWSANNNPALAVKSVNTIGPIPGAGQVNITTLQNGYNIDATIKALVSENKADLVSSPNITVRDNLPATISTTDDQVFASQTVIPNNNGQPIVTNTFLVSKIPLSLVVTPKISRADRRVLMKILFNLTTISGSPQGVGAPAPTSQQTADTSVSVFSGDTAVIGGLVRQSDTRTETKVPVLGDIPLLGLLFKSSTTNKVKKEVIIFITPSIVED